MTSLASTQPPTSHREPVKRAQSRPNDQQRRREELLRRQKDARRNLTEHARSLAAAAAEDGGEDRQRKRGGDGNEAEAMEVAAGGGGGGGKRNREAKLHKRRDYWSAQFACPEWMTEIPPDLNGAGITDGSGWFVVPRPEGKRMLVIAADGWTLARGMNGAVSNRWRSALPSGGVHSRRGAGCTLLDTVYHELDQTYYVLDMLCWNDYSLYDCTFEFRQYWVRTKLAEADADEIGDWNPHRIRPLPVFECDPAGLAAAYAERVPFIRDGLLFGVKAGHYCLGTTPLLLLWKDDATTRYLREGARQTLVLRVGAPEPAAFQDTLPEQQLLLGFGAQHLDADQLVYPLATSDDPPVVLRKAVAAGPLQDMREGDLLRFYLDAAETAVTPDGSGTVPVAHGLVFDKRSSPARPMADCWSKALFQTAVRRGQGLITIRDIALAAAHACAGTGAAAPEGMATDGGTGAEGT